MSNNSTDTYRTIAFSVLLHGSILASGVCFYLSRGIVMPPLPFLMQVAMAPHFLIELDKISGTIWYKCSLSVPIRVSPLVHRVLSVYSKLWLSACFWFLTWRVPLLRGTFAVVGLSCGLMGMRRGALTRGELNAIWSCMTIAVVRDLYTVIQNGDLLRAFD